MNDDGILGATLGQLGQTVKKVGQQIVKLPEEMGADLGEQIRSAPLRQGSEGQAKTDKQQWKSDEERVKFLKDLYGKTDMSKDGGSDPQNFQKNANLGSQTGEKPSEFQEQIKDKSPEEQKELIELRNQLHKEVYYDPTFNPVKKQEERPAEKVENEKKQEMAELQKKEEKKPQPLAVVREQNKAEQFRGAAG